jgi:hypothetical protein
MVSVLLKYTSNNKSIVDDISVPENWNELSTKQLLYIANLWQAWQLMAKNNLDLNRVKALLFVQLIKGTTVFNKQKRVKLITKLTNEEQWALLQLTNFIFIKNTLTVCPFPVIRIGFKKYYAPNNKLGNIKALEFHFADFFYIKYLQTESNNDLNNLIACIYRPAPKTAETGEKRVPFYMANIEKNAKAISKLSFAKKQAILLWYIGCRTYIVEQHPHIFSSENQQKSNDKGFLPLIMALSGNKFGNYDQTAQTDLVLILIELEEAIERKPKNTNGLS